MRCKAAPPARSPRLPFAPHLCSAGAPLKCLLRPLPPAAGRPAAGAAKTADVETRHARFKSVPSGDDPLRPVQSPGSKLFHGAAAAAVELAIVVIRARMRVPFALDAHLPGPLHQTVLPEQGERAVDRGAVHAGIALAGEPEQGSGIQGSPGVRRLVEALDLALDKADDQAALRGHAHAQGDEGGEERGVAGWERAGGF